jgi:hypothetical protein
MYHKDGSRKSARLLALGAQRHDLQELVTAVKDAHVFITPCTDCFEFKRSDGVLGTSADQTKGGA